MKHYILLTFAFMVFSSHDMYLKLDTYYLKSDSDVRVLLYNGTFEKSDNVITRDRMTDVSLVGNDTRVRLDTSQWTEEGDVTILNFRTGKPGTWVAGVSTAARNIEMDAEAFNSYLEHDGVLDMIELRKAKGNMNDPAIERYSKHVKAIFQVGDQLSNDWQTPLGYPIEFVPMDNPSDMHPGHAMTFKLLWKDRPLANQLVYVGSAHGQHSDDHHHHGDEDHHHDMAQLRTDANGMVAINITHEGVWYLRTIHLTELEEEGLTHESNWATLTFEVGEGHSHAHTLTSTDDSHDHEDEGGIPGYVFWLGSLALIGLLFFIFYNKSK